MKGNYIAKIEKYINQGISALAVTGALLAGSGEANAQEAQNGFSDSLFGKRQKITLSLDYVENAERRMEPGFYPTSEATGIIQGSQSYADFLSKARSAQDKIGLLSDLGHNVGNAYDHSYPQKRISFDRVFQAAKNGGSSGAICGGTHKFLARTAEAMGLPAAAFLGRFYEEGSGHISSIFHSKTGFYGLDYGTVLDTRTHNLEKALRMIQANQGRTSFSHDLYRDGKFLRVRTKDGDAYFRFLDVDPTTVRLVKTIRGNVDEEEDRSAIVLGNRELSIARDFGVIKETKEKSRQSGVLRLKFGALEGVPDSGMNRSYNFEAMVRHEVALKNNREEFSYFPQAVFTYGLFDEKGGTKHLLGVLFDCPAAYKRTVDKDFYLGVAGRLLGALDIGGLVDSGFTSESRGAGALLKNFDFDFGLMAGKRPVELYGVLRLPLVYDGVDSQNPTFTPTEFFGGLRYESGSGNLSLEVGEKAKSLFVSGRLEREGVSGWFEAGKGQMAPFTPEFYFACGLNGEVNVDGLVIGGDISGNWKKWSRGEDSVEATANLSVSLDAVKRLKAGK